MKRDRQKTLPSPRNRPRWSEILSRSLRGSLRQYKHLRRRFIRKPTAHGLHGLRVEVRRQLALAAFGKEMGGRHAARARRMLKRRLHATGSLRDTDVLLVSVGKLLSKYPELGKFRRHLLRQRRRAIQRVQHRLKRRPRKLSRRVRALAKEMDASAKAGHAVDKLARALHESISELHNLSVTARRDKMQFHQARIALKRLRYMVEALGGVFSGEERSWVAALRRAQHAMGEVNDLDTFSARLGKYVARRSRERRRLQRVKAVVIQRQRRLRRKPEAGAPPMPAKLRSLLALRQEKSANDAGK